MWQPTHSWSGLVWRCPPPDAEQLLAFTDDAELVAAMEEITTYADNLVSIMNPGVYLQMLEMPTMLHSRRQGLMCATSSMPRSEI